jgi:hypothetical protein
MQNGCQACIKTHNENGGGKGKVVLVLNYLSTMR